MDLMATKKEESEAEEKTETSGAKAEAAPAEDGETQNPGSLSLKRWLSKQPQLSEGNFRDVVLHVADSLLEEHGGPVQYLTQVLGPEPGEPWKKFASDLKKAFPRRPDYPYQKALVLPQDTGETFRLSLWQLGWTSDCSSKPATFKCTTRRLIDEYLCSSFVTEGDPILLYQGPAIGYEDDDGETIFFAHYVKGAARATSALFLAHVLLYVLEADLVSLHPALQGAFVTVFARKSIAATDATSIALENAKLSARGDIRKAHDTSTWLSKLNLLKQKGLSPTEIIKRWNETATRDSSLLGAKRTALLQLLDLPDESVQLLLRHSSHFGPEATAFSNETFANKRLSPGYVPRGLDKTWQKRLAISHDGFRLFLKYVHACHLRRPQGLRKKWDKELLEEALNLSQCLASCMDEVTAQHPVPMESMEANVIVPFLDGNVTMELEIQAVVSEAKSTFQPSELACFKEVIATCLSKRDNKMTQLGHVQRIAPGELEQQAFDLVMRSLEHDKNSYAAWVTKCQDREAGLYFQQLQHTAKRHGQAKDLAGSLFQKGPQWQMELATIDKRDTTNVQTVQNVVSHIVKVNQLAGPEDVHVLSFINWSSPSTYNGTSQKGQANLTGALVNGNGLHLGVCMTPTHFYKRGSLHKAEQACMALLGNACLNTDSRFALAYSGKKDDRERRALMQPGVLLFPGAEEGSKGKEVWQLFRNAQVFQTAVITDVEMQSSNDMLVIEDMHEEALPGSSDATTHVSQAEKHQQIGMDAARKLLKSVLPPELPSRGAFLILDTTAHTMELAKAVFQERASKSSTTPLYYLGLAEKEGEREWQQHHVCSWLAEGFLNGSIPLPVGAPALMPKELPAELATSLPPKPDLNTLVWSDKKVNGLPSLKTPEKVLQAYHDHASYGGRFQDWLKEARECIPLDRKTGDKETAEKKRTAATVAGQNLGGGSAAEPPTKASKTDVPLQVIELTDLPTPLCWQATLPSANQKGKGNILKLVITIGKKIFITNDGSAGDLTIPAGTTIAGYFKGGFHMKGSSKSKNKKDDDEVEVRETDCVYELRDANTQVLFEGKVTTVGKLVAQKRALTPLSVNVCYYELIEQPLPGEATFFKLNQKSLVLFRPETAPVPEDKKGPDGSCQLPFTSMAGCLSTSCWQTAWTKVLWSVKWCAKGLQPIRPVISTSQSICVPQGKAVELTANP